MPTVKKRVDFKLTEEGIQTEQELKSMDANLAFNTVASYSANSILHPDHEISFVDKHMKYITEHPSVNVTEYLSNLRLMTRIRK
jgi:hypothetical protein